MNIDIEKFRKFMEEAASERGAFTAFALFLREDAPGVWDLVVSAPWLKDCDQKRSRSSRRACQPQLAKKGFYHFHASLR